MNEDECSHRETEEVVPVGSEEVVALVCTSCLKRLPIWHGCPDCLLEAIYVLEQLAPIAQVLVEPCGADHSKMKETA